MSIFNQNCRYLRRFTFVDFNSRIESTMMVTSIRGQAQIGSRSNAKFIIKSSTLQSIEVQKLAIWDYAVKTVSANDLPYY